MNVLLTTSAAPDQTPFSTTEKRPPIGIGYLISVLRNAGHKVFFIDNYLQPSDFLETSYLQNNNIDIIGIYTNTICFRDTLRMVYCIEDLRQSRQWNGKVVVGGPHASVAPETIPDFIDHIVIGEGEYALLDIVDGKIKERIVKYSPIADLDQLPMPAWDYFADLPYDWSGNWLPQGPVFTMNTSRGCPFDCSFCSVGSIWGKRYTYLSAERIVADIKYLITNHGAKGIYFREDNFTLNKKRLRKFCNLMIENNLAIPWVCESRASSLTRNTVELMARAGAKGAYIGVESGSQRLLDFMHKRIKIEDVRRAFRLCKEFGINTAASIIVGVPTETENDLDMTKNLLNEITPTVTWFNVFVGIPKSKLYAYSIENKLYEFIDDRGLVYLKGHNQRVRRWYGKTWDANIPIEINNHRIERPKVSVIMSVFNGEAYVKSAVQSIQKQSYNNFELIITNDGSTDNTAAILSRIDDPRVIIVNNPSNLGLTKSLNLALTHCRGVYVARMDADDISHPLRIEKQVAFLDAHPEYAMVGSSYYVVDNLGKTKSHVGVLTDSGAIKEGLKTQNWFGHGTVMMRKSALASVGGYDEQFVYAQDYDLWLKLSEKYEIANLEEPLYFWRNTKSAISNKNADEQQACARLAQKKHHERKSRVQASFDQIIEVHAPLVSVIVPTFNRPEMLSHAISSIQNQTFSCCEIIVVNDAGDPVEDRLNQFKDRSRINYVRHAFNRGLAASRNSGIRLARGKYIAYLDDDDLFYHDHLEKLVNFLETTEYKVAYTDAYRAHQVMQSGKYIVTKRDIPYSYDFDYDRILYSNFVPVLCFMHEKACLDGVGGFDETLNRHEDWDLWIRLSRKYKIAHIKKITCEFSWRQDGTSMTSGGRVEFRKTYEQICDKYHEISKHNPTVMKLQSKTRIDFYLAEAQELLRQNNVTEAIRTLEKCLQIDSSNIHVLSLLQQLHKESGSADKAEIYQALAKDLDSMEIIENLVKRGKQLFSIGNLKAAADCFRGVIDIDPLNLESITNLGDISLKANMMQSALFFFCRASEIDPLNIDLKMKIRQCENEIPGSPDSIKIKAC